MRPSAWYLLDDLYEQWVSWPKPRPPSSAQVVFIHPDDARTLFEEVTSDLVEMKANRRERILGWSALISKDATPGYPRLMLGEDA